MTDNAKGAFRNVILHGDSVALMRAMPRGSVDFILTDPPYLVNYRGRDGRTVRNDDNTAWLRPAVNQMHRVLKPGGFMVSFYGWQKADLFMQAWRDAGFRIVGHIVFRKSYASTSRFLQYTHESAFLLAKGDAEPPRQPIPDVIDMPYSGNKMHPTQKPVAALLPLVHAFCPAGGLVMDPFAGSGSSLVAAQHLRRDWLGMELDETHAATASRRLTYWGERRAA
ncbi:DNA methyltransferase [Gluconacetobacter asukensis]|uniref:Methyltransferase n=1 Tax=Gluconacetobacter asukensis TaxID=1017181 RepID=A0A7W4J3K8_9PROT|nr:DNA methyltransferase [Gluconacetobacter asukensis]MBB2174100.1 DNA methylase [Gluconacetobacter asukensis]